MANNKRYYLSDEGSDYLIEKVKRSLDEKPNKSDIPTKDSQLENDAGYITSADVPKNVSEFSNDAGYVTASDLPTVPTRLADFEDYKSLWMIMYPIGSIYISYVDTDPSITFGGTWEQLTDIFLYGAGSKEITLKNVALTDDETGIPYIKAYMWRRTT